MFGMALALKRGELKIKGLDKDLLKKLRKMTDSMSEKQLKDFATTPESNLPHKAEMIELVIEELMEGMPGMVVPPIIKKIYNIFKKNRKQIVIAGGAVRDAALGIRPKDYDLATNAKPEEVLKYLKSIGLKTSEGAVGKQFGVVIAKTPIGDVEIATFRKDIGKGRRPDSVEFTDIADDVKRRDLTINALYYDIGLEKVIDLVGGIKDLRKKQIRTVGKPKDRFDEDPLRKLRVVRFAARLSGKIDKETDAELKYNPDISMLSAERIRAEFIAGIANSKNPQVYLKLLEEYGMLSEVFKGLKIKKPYIQSKNILIQLAWMLQKNPIDSIRKQLKQLKYTNQEVDIVSFLLNLKVFKNDDVMLTKKLMNQLAIDKETMNDWGKIIRNPKLIDRLQRFKLSITGKDATDKDPNIRGAEIGATIRDLETKNFAKFEDLNECFYSLEEEDKIRIDFPELEAKIDSMIKNIIEGKFSFGGKYLKMPDGEITSIPDANERRAIIFDVGRNQTQVYKQKGKIYIDTGRYDKYVKDGKDLAKWLNKENAKYLGVDRI
jgi:tRNA nucleotidyltransferase/poly(A) polymerase